MSGNGVLTLAPGQRQRSQKRKDRQDERSHGGTPSPTSDANVGHQSKVSLSFDHSEFCADYGRRTVAGDRFCRAERFAAYAAALGDRFIGRVLPDSAANPDPPPFFQRYVTCPHSVVTAHLIDEAGQPTIAARDEILAFFTQRLAPGQP